MTTLLAVLSLIPSIPSQISSFQLVDPAADLIIELCASLGLIAFGMVFLAARG